MSHLAGEGGEIRFTVTVTRAKTGAVETYEMVGKPVAAEPAPEDQVATDNEPQKES